MSLPRRLCARSLPHLALLLLVFLSAPVTAQQKRALTFTDLMQIRQIEQPSISADGRWVAFTARPDRGDPEVIVRSADGRLRYAIALGARPLISADGAWVAARLEPTLEAQETAKGDTPRRGLAVLATSTGELDRFDDVQDYAFSEDGRWLAWHRFEVRAEKGSADSTSSAREERPPVSPGDGKRKAGTPLVIRSLADGTEVEVLGVRSWAFAPGAPRIAYAVASSDNARDGLYVRDLVSGSEAVVDSRPFGHYAELSWSEDGGSLAFVRAEENTDGEPGRGTLVAWNDSTAADLVDPDEAPGGWLIPTVNELRWSEDGQRLFFGWRPLRADEQEAAVAVQTVGDGGADTAAFDAFDTDAILQGRGVDVWHWLDPRVNPQQKILWPQEKDRTYRAVYHVAQGRAVELADVDLPDVEVPSNARVALATSDVPYRRQATWTGGRRDLYAVDLANGTRTHVAERLERGGRLSPGGRFVLFWQDGHYHLTDVASGATRNLTEGLGVSFADEDHDTPDDPGGYGDGGWIDGDAAVLLYDKFDIWVVPTDGARARMLTDGAGRRQRRQFRVVDTDPETESIGARERLLLTSYHDVRKNYGFYEARVDRGGVTRLLEEDRRFRFLAKAEEADTYLFTREDYDEFPDLWLARPDFSDARRLSDVNPGLADFAWGSSELVEWSSADGTPLHGVVIKPGNYDPSKRYPVLVYYYELFSQRLHEFNEPAVNHRPSFPLYASNGYVVFLPDVRFEVGRPGFSATKAIVPGVQHLIDMGLADPDAIALHGHSWSGYQTAFVVTQTDIFKTAIAGAPVGNMTSAYSGIRWGSGLARQFQYEQGQSRLSGSLWEARDEYIDNSPVFFADRIHTPLLILHGDRDDAVPWYQSIELYLALRRLDREVVFLQYRDEPHHPQKYANKLDWAIKMKEWLDHYLKGEPAADWIANGVPYQGR